MRKFFLTGCFILPIVVHAQFLQRTDSSGATGVRIHTEISDTVFDFAFVHLHANEITALNTVTTFLQENKGSFVYLQHGGGRNVNFRFQDTLFEFDPNRMFTGNGRKNFIHPYSEAADSVVERLAADVLLQLEPFTAIIAVHNNTSSNYSIKSYCEGGIYEKEASKVCISRNMDEDDFIFTTDDAVFRRCKKEKINVVLQDNEHCTDDGSLSVYYANKHISYINIEAENEHMMEQMTLLRFIYGLVNNMQP
jgi:hypothetical protein